MGLHGLLFNGAFFLGIWVSQVLNAAWDALTGAVYGTFWAVVWGLILAAAVTSYLGFGLPGWFCRLIKLNLGAGREVGEAGPPFEGEGEGEGEKEGV
ncbi:MAG: hypothetical protein Kow0069_05380 [Promethearchaeota archaeon]